MGQQNATSGRLACNAPDAGILFRARRILRARRGVAASEYAILAVAVVIVVGIAVRQLIAPTTGAYVQAGAVLTTTQAELATRINPGSR